MWIRPALDIPGRAPAERGDFIPMSKERRGPGEREFLKSAAGIVLAQDAEPGRPQSLPTSAKRRSLRAPFYIGRAIAPA